MMKKMQAAFAEHFDIPLVIMKVDIPTPHPGQIPVKSHETIGRVGDKADGHKSEAPTAEKSEAAVVG